MSAPVRSHPPPVGSRVELRIETLSGSGDGVGRIDGWVVFVPLASPLDRLLVEIESHRSNHLRARLVEVRQASPERRAPFCALFGRCGGCAWQHVAIEAQRAAKVEIVRGALQRLAGLAPPRPIELVGGHDSTWRTRATLHVTRAGGVPRVGFQRGASHEVEPVADCPVLVEPLREVLRALHAAPERIPVGAAKLHLAAGDGSIAAVFASASGATIESGPHEVERSWHGRRFVLDARGFFQGHDTLVEPLVRAAVDETGGRNALDLYSGSGLFALALAERFEQVLGLEVDPAAVARARANAERNRISNVRFEVARLDRKTDPKDWPADLDLVLLDPPRSGADAGVLDAVVGRAVREVRFVSCDPPTFARDLRRLVDGGYELDTVTALDLFPHTPHVECVARLVRA